mmetsp:Transcript_101511/g.295841  ORF Transcript_101511/g.295841 Transcript_101511/m.295841 type:complete len:573 (+) Transcript_101511:52-1770(+)
MVVLRSGGCGAGCFSGLKPKPSRCAILEAQLAEKEAKLLQAAAKTKEDEISIEHLKHQAAEQSALVVRLQTSLLASQAVQTAELKACLRQWGKDVAELQERLSQQALKVNELEAQLACQSDGDQPVRSSTMSSTEACQSDCERAERSTTMSTEVESVESGASPLEAGLEWTGDLVEAEAEKQVQPLLRRMRTSLMEEMDLPPDPARMEELTAASLSQWVYTANMRDGIPDQPSLPHLPFVSVQAHCVLEDARLGSLKVATATAQIPGGRKVFFVIFKGTSYLLDIVNWNVEHDYKETGDPASFIHKGAAGMLRNLLFLKVEKDTRFLNQLQSAYQSGARRMVLTGHSLGGLYATGMLLAVFKHRQGSGPELPSGARQLLDSVRCITFGAPMCFGSDPGKEQAPSFLEFEAFVRERAVNFMNEGDPCPRAWSAVDPRELMAKAAEALKRGITVERGGVKGRIAGKVVDALTQGILGRPDFERQIVGCSRDFRHLSRIRLLSRQNKPCLHWRRDFGLARQGFEDHAIARYVERLMEASISERPCCQIYDDDGFGRKITFEHLVGSESGVGRGLL